MKADCEGRAFSPVLGTGNRKQWGKVPRVENNATLILDWAFWCHYKHRAHVLGVSCIFLSSRLETGDGIQMMKLCSCAHCMGLSSLSGSSLRTQCIPSTVLGLDRVVDEINGCRLSELTRDLGRETMDTHMYK